MYKALGCLYLLQDSLHDCEATHVKVFLWARHPLVALPSRQAWGRAALTSGLLHVCNRPRRRAEPFLLLKCLPLVRCTRATGDRERGCMPSPLRHRLVLGTALLLALGGAAFGGHKMAQMQAK